MAERLARAGIDAGGGFAARLALGEALYGQQRFVEAEAELASIDGHPASDAELVRWAGVRAVNLHLGLERSEDAEAVLLGAEDALRDPNVRAELAAERAAIQVFAGRLSESLATATAVLDNDDLHERARLIALRSAVIAWALTGKHDLATTAAAEGMQLALKLREEVPNASIQLASGVGFAHFFAGRLDQAENLASSLYELALAQRDDGFRGILAAARARVRLAIGDLPRAVEGAREAAVLLQSGISLGGFLVWSLATLSQAEAARGSPGPARDALEMAEAARSDALRLFDVDLGLSHAWVAAAEGEVSLARKFARDTAEKAAACGQIAGEAIALHDLVRLGDHDALIAARLTQLAAVTDGGLAQVYLTHAQASVADDGHALEEAGAAFADVGANLLAAECFAEASAAHQRAGRRALGMAASERSHSLAAYCPGAATPALQLATAPISITPREREVATLAARGLTSPAIAERLFISVRTVEGHLDKVYVKLGIKGRAELAAALGLSQSG